MLIPACDAKRYELLGAPGHASCAANLDAELARQHRHLEVGHVPQPVNLFMSVAVAPDSGALNWGPSPTKPGDSVTLRAEAELLMVVSACPQDLNVINSGGPTRLMLEVVAINHP